MVRYNSLLEGWVVHVSTGSEYRWQLSGCKLKGWAWSGGFTEKMLPRSSTYLHSLDTASAPLMRKRSIMSGQCRKGMHMLCLAVLSAVSLALPGWQTEMTSLAQPIEGATFPVLPFPPYCFGALATRINAG
jgi:hypothetical protein